MFESDYIFFYLSINCPAFEHQNISKYFEVFLMPVLDPIQEQLSLCNYRIFYSLGNIVKGYGRAKPAYG